MGSWSFAPRDVDDGDNALGASLPIFRSALAAGTGALLSHITSSCFEVGSHWSATVVALPQRERGTEYSCSE